MITLRSHTHCPPGEFFVSVVLRDGKIVPVHGRCNGQENCYQFGPNPEIKRLAMEFAAFLKANNLPGQDVNECIRYIDDFTCTRLGGDPQWCENSDSPTPQKSFISTGGCGGCGAKL